VELTIKPSIVQIYQNTLICNYNSEFRLKVCRMKRLIVEFALMDSIYTLEEDLILINKLYNLIQSTIYTLQVDLT